MKRLPTRFVSHGAPTFALEPGIAGPRLAALGRALQPLAAGAASGALPVTVIEGGIEHSVVSMDSYVVGAA